MLFMPGVAIFFIFVFPISFYSCNGAFVLTTDDGYRQLFAVEIWHCINDCGWRRILEIINFDFAIRSNGAHHVIP